VGEWVGEWEGRYGKAKAVEVSRTFDSKPNGSGMNGCLLGKRWNEQEDTSKHHKEPASKHHHQNTTQTE